MNNPTASAEIQRKMDTAVDDAPLTFKMVQQIADTDMVPKHLRGKEWAIVACVQAGRELGLPPFEAMRSIDVLDGRANLSAELIMRRIREAGHKVKVVKRTRTECVLRGARTGAADFDPEWDVEEVEYTWDEASKVVTKWRGRWQKNDRGRSYFQREVDEAGNPIPESFLTDKDNWLNYPEDMLFWRALTRLARQMFPDAIGATKLTYTQEEIHPEVEVPHVPTPLDALEAEGVVVDAETGEVLTPDTGATTVEHDADDEVAEAEIVEDEPVAPAPRFLDGRTREPVKVPVVTEVEEAPMVLDDEFGEPLPVEAEVEGEPIDPFGLLQETSETPDSSTTPSTDTPPEPDTQPGSQDGPDTGAKDEPESDPLGDAWSTIYVIISVDDPTDGNMDVVRDRVERLYDAMATTGLWPVSESGVTPLQGALKKHYDAMALRELKRDRLDDFAKKSVSAARIRVEVQVEEDNE